MESRGRVEHYRVARWMGVAFENRTHRSRIALDVSAGQTGEARPRKAEVFRSDDDLADMSILVELGDPRRGRRADLIEAIFAPNDPCPRDAETAERFCDEGAKAVFIDADELMGRPCGVRQGPEDVEDRARAQFAPCDGGMAKSGMVGLREKKCDPSLAKNVALPARWDV